MENQNNSNQNGPNPMKVKKIYGIEISEFELFCVRMISDYLILDRFSDSASFVRFEQCFGPLFSIKDPKFKLVEAFREIVGKNRKYITFRRLIKGYINWKKKSSDNYSFNYFMDEVFNKMIIKKGEVIGHFVEGERIFSTKNCKFRKIITKFSVLTDKEKNKINGFVIEYDEYFKAILCIKEKKEDINLEINFNLFHSTDELGSKLEFDRDGISHIAGKYEENKGIIKFLIFKCRSGKTFYIGDPTENDGEKISPFIFGSSKGQLKTMQIGLIKDQLAYMHPRYQLSTRINENLNINFEDLNEQYLENDPPKFEEKEYENATEEQIGTTEEEKKKFLVPLILDDQFVDKMNLFESINGKGFKEIYKSYFEEGKSIDKFKDMMKKMLQDYLNKDKREEKLRSEKKNLMDNLIYKKDNFESVFVSLIKFKDKIKGKGEKEENEEEEEDDINLIKIKSGEYVVKEQNLQNEQKQNLRSHKINDNKEKEKEIKKEPKDSTNIKTTNNANYTYKEKTDNVYNNHKVVEIKYTNKKDTNKESQINKKK